MDETALNRFTPEDAQPATAELVNVLDRHRREIAVAWSRLGLQTLRPPEVVDFSERVADAIRFLGIMSETLLTGSYDNIDRLVSGSALRFNTKGVGIDSLLLTWVQSKAAVLEVLQGAYPNDPTLVLECLSQFDLVLNHVIALYGKRHATEMNRQLSEQHARTRWMLDIAQGASSTLNLDDVMSHIARTMCDALGVANCVVVAVDEKRELLLLRKAGMIDNSPAIFDPVQRRSSDHMAFDELSDASRYILKHKKPLIIEDAEHDPRLQKTQRFWLGIKSALGLPFVVNDQVVALAWVRVCDEGYTFSPEGIELAQGIAHVAALGIENARLHNRVREQTIIEERERLSRELHDNLSQALGLLKLQSAMAVEFLAAQHLEQVDATLHEMHEVASEAHTDAREAIFNLRSIEPEDVEFVTIVRRYLHHYHAGFGVSTRLELSEKAILRLSPQASLQMLRIIQEALSNVRKHAHTPEVRVIIESLDDMCCVCIEDDGQGFDPAAIGRQQTAGVGLSVMRERAESIGGRVEIDSEPGRGTRVTLEVPQVRNMEKEHGTSAYPAGG